MKFNVVLIALSVILGGCHAPSDPVRNDAYILIRPASVEQGWTVLDALDAQLPVEDRKRIQVRGLTSGNGREMMIRFQGQCRAQAAFVDHVRTTARRLGVQDVACVATLP